MDRETDRLRKKQTDKTDETWTTAIERQTDRDSQMNTYRHTDRWMSRQTDGQRDRWSHPSMRVGYMEPNDV